MNAKKLVMLLAVVAIAVGVYFMMNKGGDDCMCCDAQIENEAHKKLNDQIEKRKIISKSKIDQLVRDTNTEIQEYISSTAIKATIVLLEQKLSDDQKENLINASINEMSSVIKN